MNIYRGKFWGISVVTSVKKTEENEKDILGELIARSEEKGDLPIFNASLNNVRQISSDPEAHAMQLAQTVMKDANLSVKLLRIANSPFYGRGATKISSVSRAVVVLGFDTIKSLCLTLKLIESFNDDHPTVGMNKMVARSYLTAGFVRDIALKTGVKNAEETYVCGLCHSIGEIAVGYFMPDKFEDIGRLQNETNISWEKAQQRVLDNLTLAQIGQGLAKSWNFSDKVVKSMSEYRPEVEGPVRNPLQLNNAIVSLSSQIVDNVYLKDKRNKTSIRKMFSHLEDATGIKSDKLEEALSESFTRSCELIKSYGLSPIILQPTMDESSDSFRDKLAREFSFLAYSQSDEAKAEAEAAKAKSGTKDPVENVKSTTLNQKQPQLESGVITANSSDELQEAAFAPAQKGDPMAQLTYIQEITTLVTEGAPLSTLFLKILQGLKEGVGFDRVALSLVTPDRKLYATRLSLGDNEGILTRVLRGNAGDNNDIFARIIEEGSDLLIEDLNDGSWNNTISSQFIKEANCNNLIVAGLKRGPKPIGLFYADNAISQDPITPMMRRGFLQFIAQSRLAVQIVN